MNSISDAITYSLYKMGEGRFSVAITYEYKVGEKMGCNLFTYHRGMTKRHVFQTTSMTLM